MGMLQRLCLLVYFLIGVACSESPALQRLYGSTTENGNTCSSWFLVVSCCFVSLLDSTVRHEKWLRFVPDLKVSFAAQTPPGVARALSAPLIGHDGCLIACSRKNLLAFEPNGSVSWIVPLGYNCKEDISPVAEREKVIELCEFFMIS